MPIPNYMPGNHSPSVVALIVVYIIVVSIRRRLR